MATRIHPTAEVSSKATIGEGTNIWQNALVREDVKVGKNCSIGKGAYLDVGVLIGDNSILYNNVSIFRGVTLEEGVLVGPHTCFTSDARPRAINTDGTPKSPEGPLLSLTVVRRGASIGANATIVPGITVGLWAMIGAGSVVNRDVPDYGMVSGNPSRLRGFVCPCGEQLEEETRQGNVVIAKCPDCGQSIDIPIKDWEQIH